ncbi:MAG: hypothetical protein AAGH90_01700 [Pseudomonadota bacterium]
MRRYTVRLRLLILISGGLPVALVACDARETYRSEATLDIERASDLRAADIVSDAHEILIAEDGSLEWNSLPINKADLSKRLQSPTEGMPNIILVVDPRAASGRIIALQQDIAQSEYELKDVQRAITD